MLAVRGPGLCKALHSHHAMHFVLAVDGELGVRTRDGGRWISAAGVLTAPNIAHAIDARGHDQVLIFLDPESDAGAMLRPALSGPLRLTSKTERAKLVRGVDGPQLFANADGHEWLRQVAEILRLPPQAPKPVLHPAVQALLQRLGQMQVPAGRAQEDVADRAGLPTAAPQCPLTPGSGGRRTCALR